MMTLEQMTGELALLRSELRETRARLLEIEADYRSGRWYLASPTFAGIEFRIDAQADEERAGVPRPWFGFRVDGDAGAETLRWSPDGVTVFELPRVLSPTSLVAIPTTSFPCSVFTIADTTTGLPVSIRQETAIITVHRVPLDRDNGFTISGATLTTTKPDGTAWAVPELPGPKILYAEAL